jgi:hypothetical protein
LAVCARVRDEAIRTRFIDSETRLTGGGHPRPSARKARGQMAQVIKAGSVSHRGERRHGTLSRARTTAPRLALPWRSRLALRRLIAAADAMRRGDVPAKARSRLDREMGHRFADGNMRHSRDIRVKTRTMRTSRMVPLGIRHPRPVGLPYREIWFPAGLLNCKLA